jgi:hypothetical protein
LPSEDAIASDLEEDNNWRIVFVSPIIIQVVVVILIYFLYNFYTPQECIQYELPKENIENVFEKTYLISNSSEMESLINNAKA